MATEILRPNEAGDETNITAEKPLDGIHWQLVDEETPDDGTSYVKESETTYHRDFYNLPASSGVGSINKITVHARCSAYVDVVQASLKICVKSDTTPTEDDEQSVTPDWALYSKEWALNPADGEVWEWADIDALQIGVSLRRSEPDLPSRITKCTQVYVEIDYTPPVVGRSQGHIIG